MEELEGPYKSIGVEDLALPTTDPSLWLWEGFLARGGITLLTSLWKSGKSTLLATLLARMKEGGQFGGKALKAWSGLACRTLMSAGTMQTFMLCEKHSSRIFHEQVSHPKRPRCSPDIQTSTSQ
jgi:hypothetical protein